jgi:diguanylate cyclase
MSPTDNWLAFVCVNLAFAGTALSIGFFAGAWFLGGHKRKPEGETPGDQGRRTLTLEHAAVSSERIRDLAVGMVSDIGQHSTRVREVTQHLQSLDLNDIQATGAGLVAAMAEIVAANNQLHQQLTEAQSQIEAQAAEIRSYELEARTDALTTLANRRAFDDELARRFSEWQRKATTFSLLILDIDHFKRLNDTYGHQVGDLVLRAIGKQLHGTCRGMDLPCRYGGEEFAVVMPSTYARDAMLFAERLRKGVESSPIDVEGATLRITCSIGVAQVLRSDDIVRTLKRADEALYRSKAAGRNCVHLHDGQQCLPSGVNPATEPSPAPRAPVAPEPVVTRALDSLANRTRFVDEVRRRLAESHRTGYPLGLLTVRLGSYGDIRRNLGMAAISSTLETVSQALLDTFRESDLVARLADQTFGVMLPGSTCEEAIITAHRLLERLENCQVPGLDPAYDLKSLVGLAQIEPGDSVESIIRRAENDLISARSGRQPSLANG